MDCRKMSNRILSFVLAFTMVVTPMLSTVEPVVAEQRTDDSGIIYDDAVDKNSQVNYNTSLGRAVEYGILADTYYQDNHTETNWAVNDYIRVGDQITEPDLATNTDDKQQVSYPYLMTKMENKIRFGGKTVGTVDIYLPDTYAAPEYYYEENGQIKYTEIIQDNQDLVVRKFFRTEDSIRADVNAMINKIKRESDRMAGKVTITIPDYTFSDENPNKIDKNNFVLDTTSYEEDDVIYVNVPAGSAIESIIGTTSGLKIKKKSDQVIVFNYDNEAKDKENPVVLNKFWVHVVDGDNETHGTETFNGDKYITSETDNSGNESDRNKWVDQELVQKIIWNMNKAENVKIDTSAGLFLTPSASKESDGGVRVTGSSAGWLASGGYVTNNSAEWHFIFHNRRYTSEGSMKFEGRKEVWKVNEPKKSDGRYQTVHVEEGQYVFSLYKTDETYNTETGELIKGDVANTANSTVQFPDINITEEDLDPETKKGTFYYVVKENLPDGGIYDSDGNYVYQDITYWTGSLNIRIDAELVAPPQGSDGVPELKFTVNSVKYYSDNEAFIEKYGEDHQEENIYEKETNVIATTQVFTFGAFPNKFEGISRANIEGKKTLTGREFEEGDEFTFTVTGEEKESGSTNVPLPDPASITINPTKGKTAAVSFNEIQFSQEDVGKTFVYTVKETGSGRGITNDAKTHTVEITVSDDDEDGNLEFKKKYSDTEANALDFVNTYQAEKTSEQLKVKKRINGKLTQDQFTFKLTPTSNDAKNAEKVEFEGSDTPEAAAEAQEVTVTGDGEADFDKITYKQPGTYEYKIVEVPGDAEDYEYDGSYYIATITVTDDGGTDPKLTKVLSIQKYDKDGNASGEAFDANEVIFTNRHISNEFTVRKIWRNQDGTDITESKNGSIRYKLKQTATPVKDQTPSGEAKEIQLNFGHYGKDASLSKTEMLKPGTVVTLVVTTPGEPVVKTFEAGSNFDNSQTTIGHDDFDASENKYTYTVTIPEDDSIAGIECHSNWWDASKVSFEYTWTSQEEPSGDDEPTESWYPNDSKIYTTSSDTDPKWVDTFTLVKTLPSEPDDHVLPLTGTDSDGKKYTYTYTAVEVDENGNEITENVSYNNPDDNTVEIINDTVEENKANLKVKKTFADNTLTNDEKNRVTFTVSGPDNFSRQKAYSEFDTNGVWDLGEVAPGEYTVTEENANKNGYTRTTTYKVNNETAQEASAELSANDDVTIELINDYEENTDERLVHDTVDINKLDEKGTPLPGATFTLYNGQNAVKTYTGESFEISTEEAELADLLPADNNGTITLYLVETVAPTGYELDETRHPVEITTTIATEYDAATDKNVTVTTYTMTIDSDTSADITNTKRTGSDREDAEITINKQDDAGAPLNGATFKLYDGNEEVATYTGGSFEIKTDDAALASKLPAVGQTKELTLKETAAPSGYDKDDTDYTVTIEATSREELRDGTFVTITKYDIKINGATSANITNTKKTGSDREDSEITINKQDDAGAPLNGATFKLYDGNEEVATYTGGSFEIKTDDAALASKLPAVGQTKELTLKETAAPSGYDKDDTDYTVTIEATSREELRDGTFVTITKYDIKINGETSANITNTKRTEEKTEHDSVTITKKDQDGERLEGAEFKLYADANKETLVKTYTDSMFTVRTDDAALASYLPAEDGGEVTLYLKETKAPTGYRMDTADHPVVIRTSITEAYDQAKDAFVTTTKYTMTIDGKSVIDITNRQKTDVDRIDDSVTVKKIDDITQQEITGAIFKLYEDELCTEEIKSYEGGTFEISTEDPQLSNYLPVPDDETVTLYLKETKAPAGYRLEEHAFPIRITAHNSTAYDPEIDTYVTTTEYTMTILGSDSYSAPNTEKHGEATEDDSVTITKKDQDGAPLPGAEFTIYSDSACTEELDKRTGGEFEISTLDTNLQNILPAAGNQVTIYLKETKAPSGYNMDTAVHPIVISATSSKEYDPTEDQFVTTTAYTMTIDGVSEIDVTNTKKTGDRTVHDSVEINKKDGSDQSDLAGAKFALYSDQAALNKIAEYVGGKFEISTDDDELAQYLPTEAGALTTLYLKETQAPDGYYQDTTAHPITISKAVSTDYDAKEDAFVTVTEYSMTIDGSSSRDITNMRNVTDEVIDDKVTITKKDQDGEKLDGATFSLLDKDGEEIRQYKETEFKVDTKYLVSVLTNIDDHMNDGDERTFKLKEIEAPKGYDLDKTEHTITLRLDVTPQRLVPEKKMFVTTYTYTLTIDGESEIDITNTKRTKEVTEHNDITITKKDQDGEALDGAKFSLYADEDCTEEVGSYEGGEFKIKTDDEELSDYLPEENNGTVTLYLKETEAPRKYNMDEAVHPVVIKTTIKTDEYDEKENVFVTTTTYSIAIDGESKIDVTNTKKEAKIKLTKLIDKYFDAGESTNATMVFTVKYTDKDGNPVEKNANVQFDPDKDFIQTVEIDHIPLDTEIEITETYSGNYKPVNKTQTLTDDDLQEINGEFVYAVTFENRLVRSDREMGIINKYEKDADGNFVIRHRVGVDEEEQPK